MSNDRAIILVGHGVPPRGYPREKVARLKALEGRRQAAGGPMSAEEEALDREIRAVPRDVENDPYHAGVEALAGALASLLGGARVYAAYNEFCAPSIAEAAARAVAEGARAITVVPSMLTPGGVHAEVEIPAAIREAEARYPGVAFRYAWPFDVQRIARMLADQVAEG